MTWQSLLAVTLAAAGIAWYSVARFIPSLRGRDARPSAILIASALSLIAVLALACVPIFGLGTWLLIGLAPWLAVALTPDTLVRATGGSLPWDAGRRQAALLQAGGGGETARWPAERFVAPLLAATTVLASAFGTGMPVCAAADRAATAGAPDGVAIGSGPLAEMLLDDPGSDFTLVWESPMNLEQAAGSRVDTFTLQQLRAARFVGAHRREWIRGDGTMLGNDVFRFATTRGAADYHRAVTAYACAYSTETFDVPGGGVGLRIRYGSGDPIRDQVAWLDGNHRVVIAIGYQEPPADHAEALRLAASVRAMTGGGTP